MSTEAIYRSFTYRCCASVFYEDVSKCFTAEYTITEAILRQPFYSLNAHLQKKNKTSWRFVAPHTEKPPGYDTLDLDDPPPQSYDAVVAAKANELAHGSLTGELIPTYRAFSSHGS